MLPAAGGLTETPPDRRRRTQSAASRTTCISGSRSPASSSGRWARLILFITLRGRQPPADLPGDALDDAPLIPAFLIWVPYRPLVHWQVARHLRAASSAGHPDHRAPRLPLSRGRERGLGVRAFSMNDQQQQPQSRTRSTRPPSSRRPATAATAPAASGARSSCRGAARTAATAAGAAASTCRRAPASARCWSSATAATSRPGAAAAAAAPRSTARPARTSASWCRSGPSSPRTASCWPT